jgi:photosystem II 13kDa protein
MIQNLTKKIALMKPQIQFVSGIEESIVPRRIRLTKSENGETGTATFIFVNPTVFSLFANLSDSLLIQGMDLMWDNKKINTSDVSVFFKEGKPIMIRSILIFKNSKEWFNFLNFMSCYSKETGLSFAEGI